jgi:uncharacterized membrane protein (UPF0127 family)
LAEVDVALPVYQVANLTTQQMVAVEVVEAQGAWASFKGLMFRQTLPSGHGMLFRPARGIHTNFMRFPIDLVFFDKELRVKKIREAMGPWRYDFTNAAGVIEMNAGAAKASAISPGDQLKFVVVNGN